MKIGDRVYYIVSGRTIRPAIVKKVAGNSYILSFNSPTGSGAICLPASRVYASEEEAEKHLIPRSASEEDSRGYPSAYMKRRLAYDFSGKPNP